MGELQKAKIKVLEPKNNMRSIDCLFNPSEYTLKEGVTYAKKNDQGKDGTAYQFIHGEGTELSLSLYFDTTGRLEHGDNHTARENSQEKKKEVEAVTYYTDQIVSLMRIEEKVHRPPMIEFSWGNFSFKGLLTSLSQNVTYFNIHGKPLRAKLDLTISSVSDLSDERKTPLESPDRTKYRTVVQGMSLWRLAYEEYGECGRWREIAKANRLLNPLDVKAGDVLIVPALTRGQ